MRGRARARGPRRPARRQEGTREIDNKIKGDGTMREKEYICMGKLV